MTPLKGSNCDKTQKLKLGQHYKSQNVKKKKKIIWWQKSNIQILTNLNFEKTQIGTKLKNSKCYKNRKPKLSQNLKKSNCDKTQNSHGDKTQKSNCDKTPQFKLNNKIVIKLNT